MSQQWNSESIKGEVNAKSNEMHLDQLLTLSYNVGTASPFCAPCTLILMAVKYYRKKQQSSRYQSIKDKEQHQSGVSV